MNIYHYADASLIREVVFHHDKDRPPVALLEAAPDASEQLSSMRAALEGKGWQAVPVYADGKAVLQVSGFKQEAELDGFLRAQHFTEGKANIVRQPVEEARLSHWDRVRRISLKLAGAFNMIGTTGGFLAGGISDKDTYRKSAAALYLLSEANLIRYGNTKSERYVREIAQEVGDFIRSQGGRLPEGSSLSHIMRQRHTGLLAQADSFLYRHPTQVTFGLSSAAATAVLGSGINELRKGEGKGVGKLGFGVGSVGLKLASLLIPEKSKEEIQKDKAKSQNIFEKTITWIQEKPLRFYGIGSLIDDGFLVFEAYNDHRIDPGKKGWIFSAIAGTGYILADIMYSISSKEHANEDDGKFTADEQRRIEAMAAESLAQQPEPARDAMAQKLGGFLARRKEMKGSALSIRESIVAQARHQKDNPWVARSAQDAAVSPVTER